MEVPGKVAFCNMCKERQNKSTEADGFCTDCDVYMCQGCFNVHLSQKLSMNHVLSAVGEGKTKQTQEIVKLDNCKLHKEEIVKYYCRLHDVIACVDCVVVDHRQCKVEFIRDLARSVHEDSDYRDILRTIQRLESEKEACNKQLREKRNENTSVVNKAVAEIRKFRKELNDYIDNVEREILEKVKQLSKENEKNISDLEEKIASVTYKISVLNDSLDPKSSPDEILFTRLIECKPQVQKVEKTLSEIKGFIDIKSFTFSPAQPLNDILNTKPEIGCLKTNWRPASGTNVPTQTQTGPTQTQTDSEISKQEKANLSQEPKAQLKKFEKTPTLGIESRATKYMPPDPRAFGINVGTRVQYGVLKKPLSPAHKFEVIVLQMSA